MLVNLIYNFLLLFIADISIFFRDDSSDQETPNVGDIEDMIHKVDLAAGVSHFLLLWKSLIKHYHIILFYMQCLYFKNDCMHYSVLRLKFYVLFVDIICLRPENSSN